MSPRIGTCTHLANELAVRLKRAVSACGYQNEASAATYVGEEFLAIARRLTYGWAAICASPSEPALRAVAFKLAHHMWGVKIDGVVALAPHDRARRAAQARDSRTHVTGKELLLTLAEAVGNDADLVPLYEMQHHRADANEARKIAQEAYAQWKTGQSMPKAMFRKVLARRLQAAGGR